MPPRSNQQSKGLIRASGVTFIVASTIPTLRSGPGTMVFVSNSTGHMACINTTGTTWKYLNVTSLLA